MKVKIDQQNRLKGIMMEMKVPVTTDKIERAYAVKQRVDLNAAQKASMLRDILSEK